MHDSTLNAGLQTALVAIPFLLLLLAGVFRLDEVFVTQKRTSRNQRNQRPMSGIDQLGQPILYDPDGRPSYSERNRG